MEIIEYKQCFSVGFSLLYTITSSYKRFVESFIDKLSVVIGYSFIAQQQCTHSLKTQKITLNVGSMLECLIFQQIISLFSKTKRVALE